MQSMASIDVGWLSLKVELVGSFGADDGALVRWLDAHWHN